MWREEENEKQNQIRNAKFKNCTHSWWGFGVMFSSAWVGCSIMSLRSYIRMYEMHKMPRIILCRVLDLAYTCDISFWFVWLFAHLLHIFILKFSSSLRLVSFAFDIHSECWLHFFLWSKINHVKFEYYTVYHSSDALTFIAYTTAAAANAAEQSRKQKEPNCENSQL